MKKNTNSTDFWHDFENQKFATFQVLQSIEINSDEKIIIGVWFISEHVSTPCSLFGPKLHNCNHANVQPFISPYISLSALHQVVFVNVLKHNLHHPELSK